MIGATGPDHAKLFTCAVLLNGQTAGTGTGKSKKGGRAGRRPGGAAGPAIRQSASPAVCRFRRAAGLFRWRGGYLFLRPGQPEAEHDAAHAAHNVGQVGHVVRLGKAVGDLAA